LLISEVLEGATDKLSEAGVLSPSVDAELIGCFILGVSRSDLQMLIVTEQDFPSDKTESFAAAILRRVAREPLQHITGSAAFRHLELEVGPGVFTPRPETELVVGLAMSKIQDVAEPMILDLCSGSGAIAISFATEVENSTVFGVEKSKEAFSYLTRNFQKYGLDIGRLRNEDLVSAFSEFLGQFDLVISNPPYIPDNAIPIDIEVQLHEPALSLYGGEDGLNVIRLISKRALELLKSGGALVLEHADSQAQAIIELLLKDGWVEVESVTDLAGKDRMISAQKP
jgi:release factor glutamine methyltransferase